MGRGDRRQGLYVYGVSGKTPYFFLRGYLKPRLYGIFNGVFVRGFTGFLRGFVWIFPEPSFYGVFTGLHAKSLGKPHPGYTTNPVLFLRGFLSKNPVQKPRFYGVFDGVLYGVFYGVYLRTVPEDGTDLMQDITKNLGGTLF